MRLGILLYIIPLILLISSCAKLKEENIPLEKFAFIEQVVNVKACRFDSEDNCISDHVSNFASGVFVGIDHQNDVSEILTANHICLSPDDGIKEAAEKYPLIKLTITDYSFIVNDHLGNSFVAKPVKENVLSDLCLLEIQSLVEPIVISDNEIKPQSRITNISAPNAIWDPNAIIVFDGRFNGVNRDNLSVYSLPTHPGSSGSPILNSNGELVGIINLAAQIGTIGFGATQEEVRRFLLEE